MIDSPSTTDGITFSGKDFDEKFQFYYRQHWVRLCPRFLRMVAGSLIIVAIGYVTFFTVDVTASFPRHLILLFLLVLFLYVQLEFLVSFYHYFLYVVVATDKKVHRIKRTMLTVDEHESIDLWVLQDIHKTQRGIVQNLFGFGTLTLQAQDSVLRLHFTPSIVERSEDVMHLRERARMQNPVPKSVYQNISDQNIRV